MEWIKDNKIWSIPIGVLILANLVLMFVDTGHEQINFDEYNQTAPSLALVDEQGADEKPHDSVSTDTANTTDEMAEPSLHEQAAHDQTPSTVELEIEKRALERNEDPAAITHPEQVSSDESTPPWRLELVCYEIGPFLKMSELEDATSMIGDRIYSSVVDDRTTKEALGYWVYLPPARSRALSRLKVEELKVKGIKDVVLMRKTEPVNAVSLGLFSKKHIAERRVDQIEKIGYKANMEIRYKIEADIWLKTSIHKEKDFTEEEWQKLIKQFHKITVISGSC